MVYTWSAKLPEWSNTLNVNQFLLGNELKQIVDVSLKDVIKNSEAFKIKFPVETNRCKTLEKTVPKKNLERNINSAYPVIHENALELYAKFLIHKRKNGTNIEKGLYKEMNLLEFIDRLLIKRAVMFFGVKDKYKLINGEVGEGNWESIGKDNEKEPLVLKNCLSYDEIKLSAFLSVSSYSYFINKGDRKNYANPLEDRNQVQEDGVIIGIIGPRLKKPFVMEYQDMVINDKQNTASNGYGVEQSLAHLISEFYEEKSLSYNQVIDLPESSEKYVNIGKNGLFDNEVYYKRLSFSIDTLLMEANCRAKNCGTTAYVHIVGIGLGVWRISNHQEKVFMDVFADRIRLLGSNLTSVSDLDFSYFNINQVGTYNNGALFPIEDHPLNGIKIHISRRDPHEKLVSENSGKLLVVSYAWDGNALPGNEYWSGRKNHLGASGDSAAASSTQISELHNPYINPKVCAANLRVVTKDDVVILEKYQENVRCRNGKRDIKDT